MNNIILENFFFFPSFSGGVVNFKIFKTITTIKTFVALMPRMETQNDYIWQPNKVKQASKNLQTISDNTRFASVTANWSWFIVSRSHRIRVVEAGMDLQRSSGIILCSSRAIYSCLHGTMSRWFLDIFKHGDSPPLWATCTSAQLYIQ